MQMSGEMRVLRVFSRWLSRISKPVKPISSREYAGSTLSITASFGAFCGTSCAKRSNASRSPSSSSSTPEEVFFMYPHSP